MSGLRQGVTTRAGGTSAPPFDSLNLGRGTDDGPDAVAENRRRVAAALGAAALVVPHQVHGAQVVAIREATQDPGACDALSTDRPGVALGVLGADCPGVLLVDPRRRAVAVVHAGWRGVVAGIVARAVDHLGRTYGCRAEDLQAAIGPGISAARYEVSAVVGAQIAASVPAPHRPSVVRTGRPGHAHADLVAAIGFQLEACGVLPPRVERHGACTYDHAAFFSHRQDAGRTGRHAVVAAWSDAP